MTYWTNEGKHSGLYRLLWDKLVPAQGPSKAFHGEILRCASRLYYDLYNNGLGNLDTLYGMWKMVYRYRDEFTHLGIKPSEVEKIDHIMRYWMDEFHGETGLAPTYEELVYMGLDTLMEKLIDAITVYAGMVQKQTEIEYSYVQ